MIDSIIEMVKTNEFAQGALIAAPVTALTYAAREIPLKIWNTIKHLVTFDLVFRSDQEEYFFANRLVMEEIVNQKWSRDFTYDKVTKWDHDAGQDKAHFTGISIGYGRHWGSYLGKPVIVYRHMEEDNYGETFKELLTISFLGTNRRGPQKFTEQITEFMFKREEDDNVRIKCSSFGGWVTLCEKAKRPIESVFVSGTAKQDLLHHLSRFEASKQETLKKGLPWHTGVLLYGPPGGGKTSLIHALASELGRDINFLNLSGIKDNELIQLLNAKKSWNRSLLVIEDIDAMQANLTRDSSREDAVNLSTLLNVLDGFMTPEGLVTVATSNHPERLDPALLRSGRFDFQAELGPLERDQANAMGELLLGEKNIFNEGYIPMMGADVREVLLKHKNIC